MGLPGSVPTPESVIDATEIINTHGCGGVSSIGYATAPLLREGSGVLSRLAGRAPAADGDDVNRIVTTVRKAVLGRLTLPCEIGSTERALVVVAGPPDRLNRRGVDRAVQWLEDQTGSVEVRGGDYPIPKETKVAAVVLLSGVTEVPRVKELQALGSEARTAIEELRREAPEAFEELISGDSDELEPLF